MGMFGGGNSGGETWGNGGTPLPSDGSLPPWWDASWGSPPWWTNGGGGGDPNGPVIGTATGVAGVPPPITTTVNTPPSMSQTAGGRLGVPGSPTGVLPAPQNSSGGSVQLHPAVQQLLGLFAGPPKLPAPPPGANALPGQVFNTLNLQDLLQQLQQGGR